MNGDSDLFIRLYLDEDVQKLIAVALRARTYDVTSARELRRWGYSDEDQLIYAAAESRSIFSYNIVDYRVLHEFWQTAGRTHAGIIPSQQLTISEAVHRLGIFLNRFSPDELRNQLLWL